MLKEASTGTIPFRYADARQAAVYLGMTIHALYNLVYAGEIPHKRRGKKLMFDLRDLDAYVERLSGVSVDEAVNRVNNNGLTEPDKKKIFC